MKVDNIKPEEIVSSSRWSQCTKRCLRISMRKWRNCTFLHSSHVELECGTTSRVLDDSAWSHSMSAQLG